MSVKSRFAAYKLANCQTVQTASNEEVLFVFICERTKLREELADLISARREAVLSPCNTTIVESFECAARYDVRISNLKQQLARIETCVATANAKFA